MVRLDKTRIAKNALLPLILVFLTGVIAAAAVSSKDVPRMTKEELLPLLGNPDVVVLDVRTIASYNESEAKIKGSVRVDMTVPIETWMGKYPKDKTLVFY